MGKGSVFFASNLSYESLLFLQKILRSQVLKKKGKLKTSKLRDSIDFLLESFPIESHSSWRIEFSELRAIAMGFVPIIQRSQKDLIKFIQNLLLKYISLKKEYFNEAPKNLVGYNTKMVLLSIMNLKKSTCSDIFTEIQSSLLSNISNESFSDVASWCGISDYLKEILLISDFIKEERNSANKKQISFVFLSNNAFFRALLYTKFKEIMNSLLEIIKKEESYNNFIKETKENEPGHEASIAAFKIAKLISYFSTESLEFYKHHFIEFLNHEMNISPPQIHALIKRTFFNSAIACIGDKDNDSSTVLRNSKITLSGVFSSLPGTDKNDLIVELMEQCLFYFESHENCAWDLFLFLKNKLTRKLPERLAFFDRIIDVICGYFFFSYPNFNFKKLYAFFQEKDLQNFDRFFEFIFKKSEDYEEIGLILKLFIHAYQNYLKRENIDFISKIYDFSKAKDPILTLSLIYKILFERHFGLEDFNIESEDLSELINKIVSDLKNDENPDFYTLDKICSILEIAYEKYSFKLTHNTFSILIEKLNNSNIDETNKNNLLARIQNIKVSILIENLENLIRQTDNNILLDLIENFNASELSVATVSFLIESLEIFITEKDENTLLGLIKNFDVSFLIEWLKNLNINENDKNFLLDRIEIIKVAIAIKGLKNLNINEKDKNFLLGLIQNTI